MDNVPRQAESCVVEAEALQSAISSHHEKRASLVMFPHGDRGPERRRELRLAKEEYINGRMTHAEFYAVMDRVQAESDADHQRLLDFKAREEAGHAKPRDFFVSYYGWTEAEADEYIREGIQEYNAREANEARARTRILQNSRHTRGH
ncbi:hypothetical protein EWM64_g7021 [Hericium alpestre]|uniref:Uncharacterized protein n=1 Tax=Hericium alpestre TaxID=135208 RepID=A0A4Y9ZU10_9AGAM|nr:hypothetical protein EWM64_g7021 [Hericium alpestre]